MLTSKHPVNFPGLGLGKSNQKPVQNGILRSVNVALYVFLISNAFAAFYSPIQDCDEVFNYWEPAHYLNHGYGLQTWEYSPEYSIRSWFYIIIHAVIGKAVSFFTPRKTVEFYTIRFMLAFICTVCETRLYLVICQARSRVVGLLFLVIMAFSPGMFHASAAFLPSSFAMYSSMLGLAAFLDGNHITEGIIWFGIGAVLGWPFAAVLIVPFLVERAIVAIRTGHIQPTLNNIARGVIGCFIILILEIVIDSFFFRKFVIIPWNLISYNIFGGKDRGPNIFGTEPWTFYIRNLLLNFNFWSMLAVSAAPLLILQALLRPRAIKEKLPPSITLVSPFYTWLAIFILQPHKEERFMYPAYPFLALNAAIAFDVILSCVGNPSGWNRHIPPRLRLFGVLGFVLFTVNIGLLRIFGIVTAYNAPLNVYRTLDNPGMGEPGDSVCFGKEWYRFPSSFLLPDNIRAKFLKSEFRGLLPGEFADGPNIPTLLEGISTVPSGMNDRNQEDRGKYVDIARCSFLVDSYFADGSPSPLEPPYILDESTWEKVSCHQFLDVSRTSTLGRIAWIPDISLIPERFRRKWGQYCLLKRRSS